MGSVLGVTFALKHKELVKKDQRLEVFNLRPCDKANALSPSLIAWLCHVPKTCEALFYLDFPSNALPLGQMWPQHRRR
jgi:hypothetical protein